MSDYISTSFSSEDEQKALALIAELKALLPFCLKLSAQERKSIPKLDDGRLPFVDKSLNFGRQQPMVVPPFTPLDELTKDVSLFSSLRRVSLELSTLAEMVNDTRTAAGSDAYQAALSIYNSAKGAAKMNIPGTQTIVDELGKLFVNQGTTKKEGVATDN